MRIACISDTHNCLDRIDILQCDVLIHAGDITNGGRPEELDRFNEALKQIKDKIGCKVVAIAGNHDWLFQTDPEKARGLISNVDYYLQDSGCTIQGLHFWGSPWTPFFCDWAFQLRGFRDQMERFSLIPVGVNVLVTHGPPKGIRDKTQHGESCGSEALRVMVERRSPKLHVFGHIHPGAGYFYDSERGIEYVNAAIYTQFGPTNPPITLDLPSKS